MITFLALGFALFVFTMTASGVIYAVGPVSAPATDIGTAAGLLNSIYLKAFAVPEPVAAPLSYFLLALPAILSFYVVITLFQRRP